MAFKLDPSLSAPIAATQAHQKTIHGITRQDEYDWLRADNWQEAVREPDLLPEKIKAYLMEENQYFEQSMQDTLLLQDTLIGEMRGRIKEDDSGIPEKDGPYAYNWRYDSGAEHPVMVRTPRDGGDEFVLIDGNIEAQTYEYFDLGDTEISPDHRRMVWTRDTSGSEYYALSIRDLETYQDLNYEIEDIGSVTWADSETLYYTKVDEHHRPSKVYRHKVGTDPLQDQLIQEELDPAFFMGVGRSRSGRYVMIMTSTNDCDEVWLVDNHSDDKTPRLVEARTEGLEYSVEHQDNVFLIVTNADGAEDFKIVSAPIENPSKNSWQDVVTHQPGRMILSCDVYRDWMIWMERENALPKIKIRSTSGLEQEIEFDEEAYSLGIDPSSEFDAQTLRFIYSSPTTPSQTFEYDLISSKRVLLKETIIPSGHQRDDYITRRLSAKSHDGEWVPITLIHHKDTAIDGSAPCLLYAYGSYGSSMPANFSSSRLSLVDRGFVHAIAHVRGGQEKGRAWYESAKQEGKKNTFHDFIATAKHLINESYTAKGQIVCSGGSAGGMLVGAVVNMAPELFAGAIADVPFVDVLNTILDDSLPLTPGEWSQWGNPIESTAAYHWIEAYSPYDQVKKQDYPAMLVTAGVSDPRVTYWEPAKWVAKLRTHKKDDNILLLRTNMSSGHFGKTGRFAALEDAARSYAFAIKSVGLPLR